MKKDDEERAVAGSMIVREGTESLALPGEYDEATYQAAVEFDQLLGQGSGDDESLQAKVLTTYRDKLLHHIGHNIVDKWPPILVGWPSSLYIPAGADWKNYWILPPSDANRYALDWTPPGGLSTASRVDGTLFSQLSIRANERYVKSEAGLGVIFTPARTLSVVSLEPQVHCSGQHRWYQMMDEEIEGYTQVKTSLILALWHSIPGSTPWDLIHWKEFTVIKTGPNPGSGFGAVTPYQRSFNGKELATPLLVQRARTYLLGVVARVSVWSTLTVKGKPLSVHDGRNFRVWGSITCIVPQIRVIEQQVHIP
jgi:hypothetical protein